MRDSTPIAGTMKLANVMDVNFDFPAKTLAEFIAMAKAEPGKINFASGGVGTSPHMSGELLAIMTGIKLTHVSYRGTGAGDDRSARRPDPGAVRQPSGLDPQIKAGRVRALGVTTKERVASIPDVPTIGETVPGYEVSVWYGISGPKGMPPEIVEKLNAAVNAVLAKPELKDALPRARRRSDADEPGRVRQARRRRDREMGQGGEVGGPEGGVSARLA